MLIDTKMRGFHFLEIKKTINSPIFRPNVKFSLLIHIDILKNENS